MPVWKKTHQWLEFLTRLRLTGMPVRLMKRYAALRKQGPATVGDRRRLLEAHRQEIESRIASLERNLAAISITIDLYQRMEEEPPPANVIQATAPGRLPG